MKSQTTTINQLRVGVIHEGCIVEDRLFKTRSRVNAGRSNKNPLSLPAADLPERCRLVDIRGGRQHLCFRKGMRGKVLINGEVLDLLTVARRKLAVRKGDRFYLPITPDVRASVVMGDVIFLFQHVRAPTGADRNSLPRSARGHWWRNLDTSFLSILAFSLFAQGGFEAVQEWYWRDTGQYLVQEHTAAPRLLQTLVRIEAMEDQEPTVIRAEPPANPAEPRPAVPKEPTEPSPAAEPAEMPPDPFVEGEDPETGLFVPDGPLTKGSSGTTRLVNAEDVNIDFTPDSPVSPPSRAHKGVGSPRIAGAESSVAASRGEVGAVRVLKSIFGDDPAEGVGAARHNDPWGGQGRELVGRFEPVNPNTVWGDDPARIQPESTTTSGPSARELVENLVEGTRPNEVLMPSIATPTKPLVAEAPDAPAVRRIRVKVRGGDVRSTIGSGTLDLAALRDVVRKYTPGLQRVFLEAARKNPGLHGKLVVRITVGASGRARVEIIEDRVHDAAFARALKRRIATWRFPKPKGGQVSFKVPFRFSSI